MSELHRLAVGAVTLVILCAASIWASVVAQDVFDSTITSETPKPADAKVIETIRRALNDDPDAQRSDDPILDDVLSVIKQQGSVLDGSVLDRPGNGSSLDETVAGESLPDASTLEGCLETNHDDRSASARVTSKALAAERLLKAARILEQVRPLDSARLELVQQMRRETVRLLSE